MIRLYHLQKLVIRVCFLLQKQNRARCQRLQVIGGIRIELNILFTNTQGHTEKHDIAANNANYIKPKEKRTDIGNRGPFSHSLGGSTLINLNRPYVS